MGRGLSDLQKHILRLAVESKDGLVLDLQVFGTWYPVGTILEDSDPRHHSEAAILRYIDRQFTFGRPAFVPDPKNDNAGKRVAVSRALKRLEQRGLIARYVVTPELGKSERKGYKLTKLGKTVAQDAS